MLVADASVWINLVATGGAHRILQVLGEPLVITDVALGELERGRPKGRRAADEVAALIHLGLAEVTPLIAADEAPFLALVGGSAANTLDDGEAATLVCAHRLGGGAVIDERKATRLAAQQFGALAVQSTVDLLMARAVRSALGDQNLSDALYKALTDARMRVPEPYIDAVVALLGAERSAHCLSLPQGRRLKRTA